MNLCCTVMCGECGEYDKLGECGECEQRVECGYQISRVCHLYPDQHLRKTSSMSY